MTPTMTRGSALLLMLISILQAVGVLHLTPDMLQAIQTILGAGVIVGVHDAIERNGSGEV